MGCYAERYAAMRRSRSVAMICRRFFWFLGRLRLAGLQELGGKKAGSVKTVDGLGSQVSVSCRIIPSDDRGEVTGDKRDAMRNK